MQLKTTYFLFSLISALNIQCLLACNHECKNGAFPSCQCQEGFTGDNCDNFSGACSQNPCHNGGECVFVGEKYSIAPFYDPHSHHFYCNCLPGYSGHFCQNKLNGCESGSCLNGGNCFEDINGNPVCKCKSEYTGENCETYIGKCGYDPCQNGGTCVFANQQHESYYCVCPTLFTGKHCEYSYPYICHNTNCHNGGFCVPSVTGSPACICMPGFTGTTCEYKINCMIGDNNMEQCRSWSSQGFCSSRYLYNSVPIPIYCPMSCGLCSSNCFDSHVDCHIWANFGLCQSILSQNMMCKKSCKQCSFQAPKSSGTFNETISGERIDLANSSVSNASLPTTEKLT